MSIRRFWIAGITILGMLIPSLPSFAYEEDTHCLLTYVLCRSVGFSDQEALTVAAVDQGMDDSAGTVANGGLGGVIPNIPEETLWHALDFGGGQGPAGILQQKEEMFTIALNQPTKREKLIHLGVFFHYQQDTWAHRHHYDGQPHSYDAFTTYNTPFGHAKDAHQPDRPPFDPVAAIMDLEDGVKYAIEFLKKGLGRQPDALFDGYVASGGTQDDNWKDPKKGKYFHQLAAAPASSRTAHRYLTDLIRIQIDAYTTSVSFPAFAGRETADELDFNKARTAFEGVCQAYARDLGQQITLPTKQQKINQGFTNLTTADLVKAQKNAVAPHKSIVFKNEASYSAKLTATYYMRNPAGGRTFTSTETPITAPGGSHTINIPTDAIGPMEVRIYLRGSTTDFYHAPANADFTGDLSFKCTGSVQSPAGGTDTGVSNAPVAAGGTRDVTLKNEATYPAKMKVVYFVNQGGAGQSIRPAAVEMETLVVAPGNSYTIHLPAYAPFHSRYGEIMTINMELVIEGVGTTKNPVYTTTFLSAFTGALSFKCTGSASNAGGGTVP